MENENQGTFEMSIRVLDTELLGFSIKVDDFKTKWVVLSVMAVAGLTASLATFGPDIVNLF